MLWKVMSVAILAAVFGVTSASAQSARDLSGPSEMPPAGFSGQQYVDSRGCVFLRAGYGGKTNWVPRVSRDRKQLCGYPASGGRVAVAEAEVAPAPRPAEVAPAPKAPVARSKPLATVATVTAAPTIRQAPPPASARVATETYVPATIDVKPQRQVVYAAPKAPVVKAPPAQVVRRLPAPTVAMVPVAPELAPEIAPARTVVRGTAAGLGGAGGNLRLACPATSPVAERIEMHGGGSRLMCTTGDGTIAGMTFPRYVAGDLASLPQGFEAHRQAQLPVTRSQRSFTAPEAMPQARQVTVVEHGQVKTYVRSTTKSTRDPGIPEGYKLAWKDDRLNINRGRQTVQGVIDQDEIWTRTVPSELREGSTVKRRKLVVVVRSSSKGPSDDHVVMSSKSVPQKVVRSKRSTEVQAVRMVPKAKTAAKGGGMVQVGSFGVAANADTAAMRLAGLGLPVTRSKVNKGGKALQIVYAGPFASGADAQRALAAARGAGFGDAFLR